MPLVLHAGLGSAGHSATGAMAPSESRAPCGSPHPPMASCLGPLAQPAQHLLQDDLVVGLLHQDVPEVVQQPQRLVLALQQRSAPTVAHTQHTQT